MVARKFDGLLFDTPATFLRDLRRALADFGRFHAVNEEVTQVSDLVPTVVYSSAVSTNLAVGCEGTHRA